MFGKLKKIIDWNRLGISLNRLSNAVKSEENRTMGYDVKTTLFKGLKALGIGVLSVAGAAALAYLGDAEAVGNALKSAGLSQVLVVAAVPVIKALATMALNWAKHRDA